MNRDCTASYFKICKQQGQIEMLQIDPQAPAMKIAEICNDMKQYIELLLSQ